MRPVDEQLVPDAGTTVASHLLPAFAQNAQRGLHRCKCVLQASTVTLPRTEAVPVATYALNLTEHLVGPTTVGAVISGKRLKGTHAV